MRPSFSDLGEVRDGSAANHNLCPAQFGYSEVGRQWANGNSYTAIAMTACLATPRFQIRLTTELIVALRVWLSIFTEREPFALACAEAAVLLLPEVH